jgi:ankyrin repeat protein
MLRSQATGCACRRRARFVPAWIFIFLGAALFAAGHALAQSDLGPSPIFDYAANGDASAVGYLLKTGTSVDLANTSGDTVLTIAAANGYMKMLDIAIAQGARIDHENSFGKTALCLAAERGHLSAVERLLKGGADINHQTRDGMTPLMLAVRSDRASVVQLLLRRKADLTLQDYTGQTAAGWARAGRDRRIDEMLRQAGAVN